MPRDFADVTSAMVSLRNRLVHVYMTIDPVEMYRHLQEDIAHFEAFESIASAWMEDLKARQKGDEQ